EAGMPANQEAFVTAFDLLRCHLDADLVVLSACQTGVSGLYRGGELEGLSQALLYSGAASVMASLWSVDSLATSHFMQTFYSSLLDQGLSKPQAWQRACESVREARLDDLLAGFEHKLDGVEGSARLGLLVQRGDLLFLAGQWRGAVAPYEDALRLAGALK